MRPIDADTLWKHKFKSVFERMDLSVDYMSGWNDAIDLIFVNAPTVDAIPVEWIKKYADKVDVEDYGMVYLSPSGSIRDMLKDWEKENESNKTE